MNSDRVSTNAQPVFTILYMQRVSIWIFLLVSRPTTKVKTTGIRLSSTGAWVVRLYVSSKSFFSGEEYSQKTYSERIPCRRLRGGSLYFSFNRAGARDRHITRRCFRHKIRFTMKMFILKYCTSIMCYCINSCYRLLVLKNIQAYTKNTILHTFLIASRSSTVLICVKSTC